MLDHNPCSETIVCHRVSQETYWELQNISFALLQYASLTLPVPSQPRMTSSRDFALARAESILRIATGSFLERMVAPVVTPQGREDKSNVSLLPPSGASKMSMAVSFEELISTNQPSP